MSVSSLILSHCKGGEVSIYNSLFFFLIPEYDCCYLFIHMQECLKCLLTVKFDEYITGIEQADCGRALRRMLQDGPPVYFRDEMALPHETSDTATNESSLDTMNQNKPSVNNAVIDESVNFTELRFASTRSTEPATLANAKFGLDRIKFWIDLIEDNKARLDDSTSLDPLLEQLKTHISCNMHC